MKLSVPWSKQEFATYQNLSIQFFCVQIISNLQHSVNPRPLCVLLPCKHHGSVLIMPRFSLPAIFFGRRFSDNVVSVTPPIHPHLPLSGRSRGSKGDDQPHYHSCWRWKPRAGPRLWWNVGKSSKTQVLTAIGIGSLRKVVKSKMISGMCPVARDNLWNSFSPIMRRAAGLSLMWVIENESRM